MRKSPWIRNMVRETSLRPADLIWPVFVMEGEGREEAVPTLPGVSRLSADRLVHHASRAAELGVPAIMIFGIVDEGHKDFSGSPALDPGNVVAEAIQAVKRNVPDIGVIADLCFCEYTDHGHCGPLNEDGDVDNDATLANLGAQALNLASAGADMLAPSGMIDGQVAAIRDKLDGSGYSELPLMAYSAKYASAFYGPFRDAAGCSLEKGGAVLKDRKTYQMDPGNAREAMTEASLDAAEGADILMVKPGLPYLDILVNLRARFDHPLAVYHVSGEFAMLKVAQQQGIIDYPACLVEVLTAFKRAGADSILTYAALEAAEILNS